MLPATSGTDAPQGVAFCRELMADLHYWHYDIRSLCRFRNLDVDWNNAWERQRQRDAWRLQGEGAPGKGAPPPKGKGKRPHEVAWGPQPPARPRRF